MKDDAPTKTNFGRMTFPLLPFRIGGNGVEQQQRDDTAGWCCLHRSCAPYRGQTAGGRSVNTPFGQTNGCLAVLRPNIGLFVTCYWKLISLEKRVSVLPR
jgi:hypothetical protein